MAAACDVIYLTIVAMETNERNLTPRLFTWVNEPEKTRTDALGQG